MARNNHQEAIERTSETARAGVREATDHAENVMQTGIQAAQRVADEFGRVFGVGGQNEDLTRQATQNLEAITETGTILMRGFQDRTGLKILEGYGLTEGTCVSTVNPPRGERRIGSIGLRVPLQAMKAVLLDDAGGHMRDCTVGETGVLVIRGPNVFAGYKVAEHNKGLWIDAGDGGLWLNTGDLGRQDADGYFYLTGRRKELIIRGGHNIDPAIIEEALHQHPAVQLAAAVGRPDPHAGELPVAYVQLKPGTAANEAELLAFAQREILERAAQPKAIRVVNAMPLTAVGKIFKPKLKHEETVDALRSALRAEGLVEFRLEVLDDPRWGTRVEVLLPDRAGIDIARDVLGRFPFRFELSMPGKPGPRTP